MIYTIGLIFTIINIIFSLDDLIWDLYYYLSLVLKKVSIPDKLSIEDIESVPPKMMALIIGAYQEEDVITDVVENLMKSTHYPHAMFHLFIGTYPNDLKTQEKVKKLMEKYPNIHNVEHYLEGPSSKADNINNVINFIHQYEKKHSLKFRFFVIHDAEDLVHPYEFLLENYLLEKHKAVQIPVFPLQEKPRIGNIFRNMVTGTYADEFAENHYRTMRMRNDTNAFVPSAGTGFAISDEVIDSYQGEDIFPVGSLTEDYKLAMEFRRRGFPLYYPLESLVRVDYQGEEIQEYIATRSMFPKTYQAAVRQKARWTHGITMQSFKLSEILKDDKLNLQSKYTFYKDWKARYSNLFVLPGYLIFTYFILSLFIDIPSMFPYQSLSWYLMIILTLMMIHRQITRFIAVKNVYGYRSAFIASCFPPLLPFRMVLGNIINMHATLRAWRNYLFGIKGPKKNKQKKIKWAKTDHEFLDEDVLLRFRRRLGDRLLEQKVINSRQLKEALAIAEKNNVKLGQVLVEQGLVDEAVIVREVCEIMRVPYLDGSLGNYLLDVTSKDFDLQMFYTYDTLPLFNYKENLVLLVDLDTDLDLIQKEFKDFKLQYIFTTRKNIRRLFKGEVTNEEIQEQINLVKELTSNDKLAFDQAWIGFQYSKNKQDMINVLKNTGTLR